MKIIQHHPNTTLSLRNMLLPLTMVLGISILFVANAYGQEMKIEKSVTYFYLNDSVRINDSSIVRLKRLDEDGNLYQIDEQLLVFGQPKQNLVIDYQKDEEHPLKIFRDGTLERYYHYDEKGNLQKFCVYYHDGNGRLTDSLKVAYALKYDHDTLVEKFGHTKFRYVEVDVSEYFFYDSWKDSTMVTSVSKNYNVTTTKKTLYDKARRVLYVQTVEDSPIESFLQTYHIAVKKYAYNKLGALSAIASFVDGVLVSEETFFYKGKKMVSSVEVKKGEPIKKTFYE